MELIEKAQILGKKFAGMTPMEIAKKQGITVKKDELPSQIEGFMTSVLGSTYIILSEGESQQKQETTLCRCLTRYFLFGKNHVHFETKEKSDESKEIEVYAATLFAYHNQTTNFIFS